MTAHTESKGPAGTDQPFSAISKRARDAYGSVVASLSALLAGGYTSVRDRGVKGLLLQFYRRFDQFQEIVLCENPTRVTCRRGCCHCCDHWVEDVYSFEGDLIADFIGSRFPEEIPLLCRRLQEDEEELIRLQEVLQRVPAVRSAAESFSETDLLLATFFRAGRPCPFLDVHNNCLIYAVRPLTCRSYFSLFDPRFCASRYRDEERVVNVLVGLDEQGSTLCDTLHFRFERFPGNTGLRSLLLRCLREPL